MFSHCLFCHEPFPSNTSLEHLRHGRRIAFDPARGRLWTVCGSCVRWTLAPIEARWEALEELERLVADRARLLSRTDNVALFRAEDLEVVRVGRAARAEEAWWRYGRELTWRRKRAVLLMGLEVAVTGGMLPPWPGQGLLMWAARRRRFGRVAVRGRSECPACGHVSTEVRYGSTGKMALVPGGTYGELALYHACPRCRGAAGSGHLLSGPEAESALRRILAFRHYDGAPRDGVLAAAGEIERAGSAGALARQVAAERASLDDLSRPPRTRAVALEIAVNEEAERRLLEMEVAELERRWREEEEVAAIVDRELSFAPEPGRLREGRPDGAGGA